MRLLRLETKGFKSFCDKTVISFFQDGISVVVGPNGCGKSNIVDAIRWTLGEQSAKHLRGASMEDVIFNGSSVRQPVSMASVTLVFSNSEHDTIPKYSEFSEISITRRLYRSGESQYLINKTACRLTDIRELFMDTGIGGKGYSIIEQGKIDQIITSRAEDRRLIIDEAAGIVKFKTKRKEAERKFAASKQNLIRVEDILAELRTREENLVEQVERADEYLNQKAKLERLQRCVAVTNWYKLKKNADRIMKNREKNIQEQDNITIKLSTLESNESSITLEITNQIANQTDTQNAIQLQKEEIIRLENKLETDKLTLDNLDKWEEKDRAEEKILDRQIKTIDYQIVTHEKDAARFQTELDTKSHLLEQLLDKEKSQESDLTEQKTELQTSRQQEIEVITRLTGEQNQLSQLRERVTEINEKQKTLQSRLKEIQDEEKKTTQSRKNIGIALNEKKEEKQRTADKIETREIQREELQQSILALSSTIKELSQELNQAETRHESLLEFISNHEEYDASTKTFLTHLDSDQTLARELGFQGTLAELISPETPMTPRAEAFLNRYFDLLVFASVTKLEEITHVVKEREIEQLRLCFMDLALQRDTLKENSLAGFLTCQNPQNRPISFIESFRLIDVPMCQLSLDQLGDAGGLIDTEASLLTPAKIFLVGRPGKSSQAVIFLERRAELSKLEKAIETLNQQLELDNERLEEETETLTEVDRQLKSWRQETVEVDLAIVGLEKELDSNNLETRRLLNSKKGLEEELDQVTRASSQFTETIDSLSTSIEANEKQKTAIQETISQLKHQIETSEISKEEYQDELQRVRVSIAGFEERRQNNSQTLNRLKEDVDQRREQLSEIQKRSAETKNKRDQALSSIKETKKGLPLLLEKLEEKEKEYKNILDRIESEKAKSEELLKRIQSERQTINTLKEKNHKLDIKLAQLAQEAKNLEDSLFAEESLKPEEVLETFDVKSFSIEKETETIAELKKSIGSMENVNLAAKSEYEKLKERLDFLLSQTTDLTKSIKALEDSINKINQESRRRFRDTFNVVNEKFNALFPSLFGGGEAYLKLTDESDILESGVEIIAQPPGKKLQNMTLLSGGEKALTAIALVFAVFQYKPSPFCLLDEVDAPLDDANNVRFNKHVKKMTDNSQFIIITHNRKTMELGDSLFGITMEEPGVSKVVSVDFDSVSADILG